MFTRKLIDCGIFMLAILLTACSPAGGGVQRASTPTPAPIVQLSPYRTATASPSPVPQKAETTPEPLPSPTATPRTHTVQRGEDLGGIAFRYKLTLKALMDANPKVNPYAMSIGTVLVIPASDQPEAAAQGAALPSPVPLDVKPVQCAAGQDGGLWCFVLVTNTRKEPLENLSAVIRVADAKASQVKTLTAYPPLDLLPPGKSIPLIAWFAPPVPQPFRASAEIVSALPVSNDSGRYLTVKIEGPKITITPDGLSAEARGTLNLKDAQAEAGQAGVVAVAYDANGNVTGARRWENKKPLAAGQQLNFQFFVYSTGSPIQRVELLAQARP